ncbi:MAG: hypothetical protein JOZ05_12785 [Acetobacteraceae bacterium]|nr:hypothetical protein [Acetobacteraceae bacterium]
MQAPFSRTLFELLDEQSRPGGTAVISGRESLTYAQLADRARAGPRRCCERKGSGAATGWDC